MKKRIRPARLLPTLVCAWCKDILRSGSPKVSHGICRGCAVHWFGKFRPAAARLRRPLPA